MTTSVCLRAEVYGCEIPRGKNFYLFIHLFLGRFLKTSQLKSCLFESAMRVLTSYISMTQRSNNLPQRVNLIQGISVFYGLQARDNRDFKHENGDGNGDANTERKFWGENAVVARNYKH